MPIAKRAIVVGAGLIGQATALCLAQRGLAVTLVDPHESPRSASWGNAGHIAVEQIEPLASFATIRSLPTRLFSRGGALGLPPRDIGAWLPFSLRLLRAARPSSFARGKAALRSILAAALPAWRRLADAAGAQELIVENGHFIVWESEASAARGRASWLAADSGTAHFRDVTPAELAELQSITSAKIHGALRCVGSGQIADLGLLADGLSTAFRDAGGERVAANVEGITPMGVVLENGDTLTADAVVVAAGVVSGRLLRPLGLKAPIIAERGYHIMSAESGWPSDLPPVVFEDRSMIVTRFRSGLRAASFVEFGRPSSPPDPSKFARLRKHVAALGLPFALPGVEWMGARPTLPDYLPAIGRSDRHPGVYYAFGHQHLGLTLAAATGEAIAALLAGEPAPFDLTPFNLSRFD